VRIEYRLVMALAAFMLGACAGGGASANPGGEGKLVSDLARIEEVELVFLESFPLQVHAIVRGTLADGCTRLGEIKTQKTGQRFEVEVPTLRSEGAYCVQVEIGFEETVPLDVYGLPAGEYKVVVNGVEASFIFQQDNILPAE